MTGRTFFVTAIVALVTLPSKADDQTSDWGPVLFTEDNRRLFAADLAKTYKLASSVGLSWPDGRQAIVTFWQHAPVLYRCIDYFDASMRSTGGKCQGALRETP